MKIKNQKNKKKGFTLIELIIVIAIIAILAALALPRFAQVRANANIKSDISNAKTLYNTVSALVTQGDIDLPATGDLSTFEIDSTRTINEGGTATAAEAQLLDDNLDNIPLNKHNLPVDNGTGFFIQIDENGDVTVFVGGTADPDNEVYPTAPAASPYQND